MRHKQVLEPFGIDSLFDDALSRHADWNAVLHGERRRLVEWRTKSLDPLLQSREPALQFGDRREPEFLVSALGLSRLFPKFIGASTNGLSDAAHG